MATEKVSLSLDEHLVESARARVGRRGLSRYVNRALERQLQHDRVSRLLEELDSEHGPVSRELREEARSAWPDPEN
ncbi:MAG: hypothetical protein MI919_37620 [Holophagales bacterium]|nr:hypothetical protein [Holophagales bacterium]